MNVVPFFNPSKAEASPGWSQLEFQQLMRLYSSQARAGRTESWAVDFTERADPQFYLLGPGPDHECVACVSRVGCGYVLENGQGAVVCEDRHLAPILARATQMLSRRKWGALATRIIVMAYGLRLTIDEKLEPLIPDSAEVLVRLVPLAVAA